MEIRVTLELILSFESNYNNKLHFSSNSDVSDKLH